MIQLHIKFPRSEKFLMRECDNFELATQVVLLHVKMLQDYENGKRRLDQPKFLFSVRHPRPNITELYNPVDGTYSTQANMRCMFFIEEVSDATEN